MKSERYKTLVIQFQNIVFNNIAVKFGAHYHFNELLTEDWMTVVKDSPLIYFINEALRMDCIISLSKLLEKRKNGDSYSLNKFLNFCESNSEGISTAYPTLTDDMMMRNRKMLEDISSVSESIIAQRDKYFAHHDKQFFVNPALMAEQYPVNMGDISNILKVVMSIVNQHAQVIGMNKIMGLEPKIGEIQAFKLFEIIKNNRSKDEE